MANHENNKYVPDNIMRENTKRIRKKSFLLADSSVVKDNDLPFLIHEHLVGHRHVVPIPIVELVAVVDTRLTRYVLTTIWLLVT